MARVVAAFMVGCSGCDANVVVRAWSCGCVDVVNPNSDVQDGTSFGHLGSCTAPRNRVLLTDFERHCDPQTGNFNRQEDPPSKHPDN